MMAALNGDSLHFMDTGGNEDHALTFSELRKVELERRYLTKRAVDASTMQVCRTWKGTIFPHMVKCTEAWFCMGLYVFVRVWNRIAYFDDLFSFGTKLPMSMSNIGKLGSCFSFFMIFYVQQAYTRYTTLYEASMACEGAIMDAMMLARATLPRKDQLKLLRYMNAAQVTAYIGLTPAYTDHNFFNGWQARAACSWLGAECRLCGRIKCSC